MAIQGNISVIYVLEWNFNGSVHFVIGVTTYGNTRKHIIVIYVLVWFFDVNSVVMSVL